MDQKSNFSHKYERKHENVTKEYQNAYKRINKSKNMVLITHSPKINFMIESHVHDWYEFTYLVEGKQEITVADRTFILSSGDFLMIESGSVHQLVAKENCQKATLLIQRSYLETIIPHEILNTIYCNSTSVTSVDEYNSYMELKKAYNELTALFTLDCAKNEQDVVIHLKYQAAFFNFFHYLVKNFSDRESTANGKKIPVSEELITQIISYLHKNYDSDLKLIDVANVFNTSPQYISKIFKNKRGVTYLEVLNEVRMNHAVFEVVNTDKSITEICFDSGFGNMKSFIAVFKSKYGMTPSKYREVHNQKPK